MPEPAPLRDEDLPPLLGALAPVSLPVLLISSSTILNVLADREHHALLQTEQVQDFSAWRRQLWRESQAERPSPGKSLLNHARVSPEVRELVAAERTLTDAERERVLAAFNQTLADKNFYQEQAFAGVALNQTAKDLLPARGPRMRQGQAERLNRALLESAYPEQIALHAWSTPMRRAADAGNVLGDANFALLLSTVIAIVMLAVQRGLTRIPLADVVENSLMSGNAIILITAASGSFGAMLQAAQVGPAIETLFGSSVQESSAGAATAGLSFLLLGLAVSAALKIAQGSSTVAMIVGSATIAAIIQDMPLAYHPVYLAVAIGAGSLVGSWMNDRGFWIVAERSGLTETEALKSWTIMLVFLGLVRLGMAFLMAAILLMAPTN